MLSIQSKIVGIINDAIVEAKGGVLEYAYQTDENPEITMSDVIICCRKELKMKEEEEQDTKSKEEIVAIEDTIEEKELNLQQKLLQKK